MTMLKYVTCLLIGSVLCFGFLKFTNQEKALREMQLSNELSSNLRLATWIKENRTNDAMTTINLRIDSAILDLHFRSQKEKLSPRDQHIYLGALAYRKANPFHIEGNADSEKTAGFVLKILSDLER